MVFMSYIHNIVAGKVEGVIVHAVPCCTCSAVLLQTLEELTSDAAVLMLPCPSCSLVG